MKLLLYKKMAQLRLAAENDGVSLSFASQRIESGTYRLSCVKDVRWSLWSKTDSRQNSGAAVTFTLFITASHQRAVSRST